MKKYIISTVGHYLAKPVFRFSALVLLFGSINSCSLDEKVYTNIDSENYFVDVTKLESAVLRGYYYMQHPNTYGEVVYTCFDNDTDISNQIMNGMASSGFQAISHYNYVDYRDAVFRNFWKFCYSGIDAMNLVLDKVDGVPATTPKDIAKKAKLKAEAKFLRAIYYFDLVRYFGDVPLKLKHSVLTDDFKMLRTPQEEIYAQIVKDLKEAVTDLPWYYQAIYDTRATKNSALGMLARVQLFRGGYSLDTDGVRKRPDNYKEYYQRALALTDTLIVNGKNALEPSYEKIFKDQCNSALDGKETLYEIDLRTLSGSLWGGRVGSQNTPVTTKGKYNNAWSSIRTHVLAYNKFGTGDLRRDVSIARFTYDKDGIEKTVATVDKNGVVTALNSENYTPAKWRRAWQPLASQFLSVTNTDINFVLLRYSDVLLMKAEALNEVNEGPTAEAYELVNKVRRRGYGKAITTPDPTVDMPTGMGKQQFLEYIQDERARELAFEGGIRRLDLIRWNILGDKVRFIKEYKIAHPTEFSNKTATYYIGAESFVDNKHELYPIPENEMREDPALTQNPGYGN